MSDDLTCHVCGQTVTDAKLLADCDQCGKLYHLNPRSDVEGIDCGTAWAGLGDSPSVQFFCQTCIDAETAQATPPEASPDVAAPTTQSDSPPPRSSAEASAQQTSSQPPPLAERPRSRRRFRRIDA